MVEHKDLLRAYEGLLESKAYWARESTICAMMDALVPLKAQLPYGLEYFERAVRKGFPLKGDKRA